MEEKIRTLLDKMTAEADAMKTHLPQVSWEDMVDIYRYVQTQSVVRLVKKDYKSVKDGHEAFEILNGLSETELDILQATPDLLKTAVDLYGDEADELNGLAWAIHYLAGQRD